MTSRHCLVVLVLCHLTWLCVSKETSQRAEKRFNIRGKEWVTAQKIINQLVDESIASRVSEAEHDVEHLLESNIAAHIKSTGKTLLRRLSKECVDKIEHCQALAKSGVCKTSKDAMRKHCAKTCQLCEDHFLDVTPHVKVALKSKAKTFIKKKEPEISELVHVKTTKVTPEKPKAEQSARKNDLSKYGQEFIPEDTIKILHSIEPLLSQQSNGVMKFHENDLSPENEKIRDAQKLLEYVKVLQSPKKFEDGLEEKASEDTSKKHEDESKDEDKKEKDEKVRDEKEEDEKKKDEKKKEHIKENEHNDKKEKEAEKNDHKSKETEKAKLNDKPTVTNKAAKSRVAKKKPKIKGTPLTSLSKTVTFKNHQYKITPVVDWEKISKMLESLGYKAVHIVGVKDKSIHKDLTEHLRKHGVHKILGSKIKPHKVAAETFVPAVHREKSWHNDEYFKAHCHPLCLHSCLGSCGPGCCKEHDKVSVKTGLAKHCHSACLTKCIPSCGSGCCSAKDELKRGHHFLHYQKLNDYHKAKEQAKEKKLAKLHDAKKQDKPDPHCHPQCKETCVVSCGKGCCTAEGEVQRDEQQKKLKDKMAKEKKEKAEAKAHDEAEHKHALQQMYKPQPRLCPAPCPQVCAPACADACCAFGDYAQSTPGAPATQQAHPGFVPNVPYPHSKFIPVEAFACKESCKFSCTYDCPRDCCNPEELVEERAHETAALSSPTTIGALQTMNYQGLAPEAPTCPNPCPGNCFPSCTVACCTSALGLPQADSGSLNPVARSSTKRVLHVTHLVRPITGLNGCALSCAAHCTPACARSGCCDSMKRRRRGNSRI